MTTPQPHQHNPIADPGHQQASSQEPSGDQDIDTAGTEANPLSDAPFTRFLLAELDREVERSRRALEHIPAEHGEWKPHERSMAFGPLSYMVATIPSWIAMIVRKDELDIAPADGSSTMRQEIPPTSFALLRVLDAAAADARTALSGTTDDHLHTGWRLKARGEVVQDASRLQMIQDAFNHWSHHRGQMVRRAYAESMARTWDAVNRLKTLGVSDEDRSYLLPNAVSIRFTESGDLLHLHHKLKMRLCYNAQEEIWRASRDEAMQISEVNRRIGRYLLPPCTLRSMAEKGPICPEGDRY